MAAAARRVGSSRGRFRWGVLAAFVVNVAAMVMTGIQLSSPPGIGAMVALAGIVACFFILRGVFRLPFLRTLAPFGALIAANTLILVLLLVLVRPYVIETYVVPTGGMAPTIEPNDRIIAEKILPPRRWDLIVYWDHDADGKRVVYCKRLVGMPGDRLRFDEGTIYIDDQRADVPAVISDRLRTSSGSGLPLAARYRQGQTITLGPDEIFLLGDNVDRSYDSRFTGPVGRSSIIGVVDVLYWPPHKMRIIR